MHEIICLNGVTAGYEGRAQITDMSMSVAERDFVGITGPNGSGKTTLLRVILGLLKPMSGTVEYYRGGHKVAHLRMGYLPQYNAIDNLRNAHPKQLSVSEEQRVIIGRAFSTYPDLLLMDEPYGQMDIKMRFYLEDEVLKLWKEFGSTVIFITHNIEEAIYLAERVLILTNKPAKIKESLQVDLPRPRNVTSDEFIELRKYVTDQIKWW